MYTKDLMKSARAFDSKRSSVMQEILESVLYKKAARLVAQCIKEDREDMYEESDEEDKKEGEDDAALAAKLREEDEDEDDYPDKDEDTEEEKPKKKAKEGEDVDEDWQEYDLQHG